MDAPPPLGTEGGQQQAACCWRGPARPASPRFAGVVGGLFHHSEYALTVMGTAAPLGEEKNPRLL